MLNRLIPTPTALIKRLRTIPLKGEILWAAAACLVLAFLLSLPASPALNIVGRDTSIYSYVSMVTRYGGLPYVDAWNHKSPLIFYYQALGFTLFGVNRWALWLMETLVLGLTCTAFFWVVKSWKGSVLASVGTVFFAVAARHPALNEFGSYLTEGYALLAQVLCLLAGVQFLRKPTWAWCLMIGFTGGLAAMTKLTTVGITLAFLPALLAVSPTAISNRRWWYHTSLIVAGGLLCLALFALYFLIRGGIREAFDALFLYTESWFTWNRGRLNPFAAFRYSLTASEFSAVFVQPPLMLPGLAVAAWSAFTQRKEEPTETTVLIWASLAFFADVFLVNLSGEGHRHYYITTAPTMSLLIVAGLAALGQPSGMARGAAVCWWWLACLFTVQVIIPAQPVWLLMLASAAALAVLIWLFFWEQGKAADRLKGWAVYASPAFALALMLWRFIAAAPVDTLTHWHRPLETSALGAYITQHTTPDERIYIWGASSYLYVEAQRFSASPFHYGYPVVSPAYSAERVPMLIAALEANQTRLIVDTSYVDENWRVPPLDAATRQQWAQEGGRIDGGDLSPLYSFIETRCKITDEVSGAHVYTCTYPEDNQP